METLKYTYNLATYLTRLQYERWVYFLLLCAFKIQINWVVHHK